MGVPHVTGATTRRHTGMARPSQPVGRSRSGIMGRDACLARAANNARTRQPTGMARLSRPVGRSRSGVMGRDVWQVPRAMHAEIAIPGGGASSGITAVRRSAGPRVLHVVAAPRASQDAAMAASSIDGTGLASVSAKSRLGDSHFLEYFPVELMKVFSFTQHDMLQFFSACWTIIKSLALPTIFVFLIRSIDDGV